MELLRPSGSSADAALALSIVLVEPSSPAAIDAAALPGGGGGGDADDDNDDDDDDDDEGDEICDMSDGPSMYVAMTE